MSEAASDYRTLIKRKHYIDLPGESPKSKLWPGVNNLIILRKHRDVVFDIKLGTGATYTVTADRPQSEYGRFYDPKRNLNVTKVTFKDGEPCHVWVGRTFEGSLILKQGDKELGRYPIRKMDCTQGCTEDPKDKPAPVLIIMHDDKEFAKELLALEQVLSIANQSSSPALISALDRARNRLPDSSGPFPALLPSNAENNLPEALPTIHAFKIKQTNEPGVPEEILGFFASGAETYKLDPLNTLSQNFILAQIGSGIGYLNDAFWNGPLKGFWNRAFIIERNSKGGFTLLFSTSAKEKRMLGYLLGVYRTHSRDVKVMTIAGGTGSLPATALASWNAANSAISVKTMTGKSMVFAIAMDTAAWLNDYRVPAGGGRPKRDWADLVATISIDVAQMWITTAMSTTLLSGLLAFFGGSAVAGFGATIGTIAIGAIAITVLVGYFVAVPFNVTSIKDEFAEMIRKTGKLLEQQLPRDYGDVYSRSTWQVLPVGAAP